MSPMNVVSPERSSLETQVGHLNCGFYRPPPVASASGLYYCSALYYYGREGPWQLVHRRAGPTPNTDPRPDPRLRPEPKLGRHRASS